MSDGRTGVGDDSLRAVFYLHWILLVRPVMMLLFAAAGMAIAWIVGAMLLGPGGTAGLLLPASLATAGLLVILSGPALQATVRRETTTVEVFDDHIVLTTGLFQKLQRSVRASEIVGVDLFQDFSQRLLGCGNLRIDTRGVDSIVVADLEQAETAKRICQQAVADARPDRYAGR